MALTLQSQIAYNSDKFFQQQLQTPKQNLQALQNLSQNLSMMNIRNFHLKSTILNFNPQETQLNFVNKCSQHRRQKSVHDKPSEPVQKLIKTFKISAKIHRPLINLYKTNINHFDFDPPNIQQDGNPIKNKSCTLSVRKDSQRLSSYQLYRSIATERNHKRGFSEPNIQKSKGFIPPKTEKTQQNPSQIKKQESYKAVKEKNLFDKPINGIKLFQIDNLLNFNKNEQIIHSYKHTSPFIATLPNKKRNSKSSRSHSFRSQKQGKNNKSFNKSFQKSKNLETAGRISLLRQQKNDQFKRSVHTAASGTARRIDYDKLNFSPISTGFFPNSSIWNKEQDFLKSSNTRIRTHKAVDTTKSVHKMKEQTCRPWSPDRPEIVMRFQEEQVFSPLAQS